jgi:Fis family transcriptional regulator
MKRIVTIVLPVIDRESTESAASLLDKSESVRLDLASLAEGATKVEILVSDEEAARILGVVLGGPLAGDQHESDADADDELPGIEQLVRQELKSADPTAINLLDQIMARIERVLIQQVYSECDHVKSRAAIRLGINRNTLLKKLRQFGALTDEEHAEALQNQS